MEILSAATSDNQTRTNFLLAKCLGNGRQSANGTTLLLLSQMET